MSQPLLPYLEPLAELFWSRVEVRGEVECWPWLRGRTGNGYGQFALTHSRTGLGRTITVRAHRVAWMLDHHSEVPTGQVIDHRCENRTCCNPVHLVHITRVVNSTAGRNGRAIERLPSGLFKVRFRQRRDGRIVETSRSFTSPDEAAQFSRSLRDAYKIPPRIPTGSQTRKRPRTR